MPDHKLPLNLVASILFWFLGLCILIGTVVAFLMRDGVTGAMSIPLLFLAWGIAFCTTGFAMYRRRWGVRWWGAVLCILTLIFLLLSYSSRVIILIAIDLAALGLLLASWHEEPGPRQSWSLASA